MGETARESRGARREARPLWTADEMRAILDAFPDQYFKLAPDGTILGYHTGRPQAPHVHAEALLGRRLQEILPPQVGARFRDTMRQAQESHALAALEYALPEAEGEAFFEARLVPLDDGTMLVVVRNISGRKRAEEALRASEERYRRIVEVAAEGVWVIDAENRTTFVNRRMAEMLGYTVEEMLGRPLFMFTDAEGRAAAELHLNRRRRGIAGHKDFQFRRKDGSGLWALVSASPICDAEGRYAGALGMVTDITERKQAEEALRVSEALLRQFVEKAPAAVAMVDTEMRYLLVSQRWLTDYHLGSRDIIGLSHYEVFPDIPPRWKEVHQRALAGSIERCKEDEFVRADGTVEWLRWEVRPWWNVRGEIGGIIMFTEVITAQKQEEQRRERLLKEVDEQRQLFQAVVANAPAAIAVLRGPSFVFELVNETFQAIAPELPMVGRPLAEVWPDVAPQMLSILEATLRTGEPYRAVDMPLRIRRAPDAQPEEAFITLACVPIRILGGEVAAVLLLGIETTAQVRARRRVEELASQAEANLRQLQAVISSMNEGVIISDREGNVQSMNPAALRIYGFLDMKDARRYLKDYHLNFELRYLDGRPLPPEEWPVARATRGESFSSLEVQVRRVGAAAVWIGSFNGAPVRDRAGEVVLTVLTVRDVTAQREAEQLREDFIAVAGHELRTPVTIIKGYAQSLARRVQSEAPDERTGVLLAALLSAVGRLEGMIRAFMDAVELEREPLQLRRQPLDLVEEAREAVAESQARSPQHRLRLEARSSSVRGEWDREALRRILRTLLDNAIRYSPRGGEVLVTIWQEGTRAEFCVKDQGIGIPPEDQMHLFERFFRGHLTDYRHYPGLGLGLYVANRLVRAHGGRIWAESQVGVGSTFCISLPLA